MRTEIVTVPCLADNYAYIIHDKSSNKNSLIDAPQAGPILKALKEKGWSLDFILITHHHSDHIDAIEELKALFDPIIFGAQKDVHRLPKLDVSLSDKEKFSTGGLIFKCFEVPGHTSGHLAFYCQSEGIAFTGDSLMAMGCGRLFEGSPAEMFKSLQKLISLPDDTMVYSGHEYSAQNAKFAMEIEANNQDLVERAKIIFKNDTLQIPNVPVSLKLEKSTNPFLRVNSIEIQKKLKMIGKKDSDIFAKLREMKDCF